MDGAGMSRGHRGHPDWGNACDPCWTWGEHPNFCLHGRHLCKGGALREEVLLAALLATGTPAPRVDLHLVFITVFIPFSCHHFRAGDDPDSVPPAILCAEGLVLPSVAG